MVITIRILTIFLFVSILFQKQATAACGVTDITWTGASSTSWNTTGNWSGGNIPNAATENAIIVTSANLPSANTSVTLGCVEVQSGTLNSGGNRTLTITGDYFRATAANSLFVTPGQAWVINMAGTAAQDLDIVDPIERLTISNNTSVSFNYPFEIRNAFSITGSTTHIYVNEDLLFSRTNSTVTIPAGVTLEIAAGKRFDLSASSLTINGTVIVHPGANLTIGNGRTLTVNASGELRLLGASGNLASLSSFSGSFSMNMAGTLRAEYFSISNIATTTVGMNVTGTIAQLDQGEFHFVANNGYALTLGAAATIPSSSDGVTFYDDSGFGNTKAINAANYNGSTIIFTNWAGVGGPFAENDPNSKINWEFDPGSTFGCGTTDRTWDGSSSTAWGTNANWSGNNFPNTTDENAIIVAAVRVPTANSNITIGCVDIQSGALTSSNGRTLSYVGDYFRATGVASLAVTAGQTWTIRLAGSSHQDFDVVDPINYLEIANSSSVAFNYPFEIRNSLTITSSSAVINVNHDLTLSNAASTLTIPAGVTMEIASGKTLNIFGSLQINGTMILNPGSTLIIGNGNNINVSSSGQLKLLGADGNVATVRGQSGAITFDMAGILEAQYFRFSNIGASSAGLNITGQVSTLDYGEFHFIPNAGFALTLSGGASMPSASTGVGFYDDNGYGNTGSINATAYSGNVVTFDNWSGNGGEGSETDPSAKIDWGVQAGTVLTLSNNSNSGSPPDPIVAGSAAQEFAIFSFALSQNSAPTDITQITFTINGTASASDIDYIQVFNQGASCQTVGAQIGSNLSVSGYPATATISIPAATVTTSGSTPACVHVYVKTTDTAEDNATVGVKIDSTYDVINSQNYSFSGVSGPPVSGPVVTILGDPTRLWRGTNSTAWQNNGNWQGGWPSFNENCKIQSATRIVRMTANEACQNTTLISSGEINWNNTAWSLTVWGYLNVESGFTFTGAANSSIIMGGTTSQSFKLSQLYPGDVIINNSGGLSSIISVDADSFIGGDLTITSGLLRVASGVTLEVQGNIVVQSGAKLDIEGGATLKLGNGRSLTINSGAELELIGTTSDAVVTSNGAASSYNVIVNGTIKADGYVFDHLGTTGVVINAAATIDPTYKLSNGTFKFPVNDNTTLLTLNRQIPGNTLDAMTFDLDGSTVADTTITNILTNAAAGTLNINSYSGDLSGASFENAPTYLINWASQTNTIDLWMQANSPASVYQGQSYNMGRFALKQTNPGANFNDTNIDSVVLTLTGNGSSNDITSVKLYYDNNCDSSAGVLKASGTFSGNPAKVTFSGLTSTLVEASTGTPPTRCFYVTYDISASASNGKTLGFSIASSNDIVTDQGYELSGATLLPVTSGAASTIIGSSTVWTGAISTDWFTAANWNGGVPGQNLNCVINPASNQPVISSGSAACNSLNLGAGASLNLNAAATLNLYGSLNNDGTMTASGTVTFTDNGVLATNQTIKNAITIGTLNLTKNVAGGTLSILSSVTANSLNITTAVSQLTIGGAGRVLILPNGYNHSTGTFTVTSGGTVRVGNGQTITVSGGLFRLIGTAEAYPQNLATKAKITVDGSGTWGLTGTAGTIQLSGFQLDYLNTSGLNLTGSVALSALSGGQFTNLSNSYSSVKVIQVNTTGSLPALANNVGINWGPNNTYPANTESYQLASSTGCSNHAMDFDNFFGDWFENTTTFDVNSKVNQVNCNITFSGAVTAVSVKNLRADAYNGAVDLRWETTYETDHMGFHVYRSDANGDHFIQLSTKLVRNINTSGSLGGSYRFVDFSAENDVTYFYYIQDVDLLGITKMWGPLAVRPENGLGTPPADDAGQNSGTRPDPVNSSPNPSPYPNGYEDLGDGVVILARSQNTIRLKIVPGSMTTSDSAWDAIYKDLSIAGYSRREVPGAPQSLEKIILIEVDPSYTNVQFDELSLSTSLSNGIKVAPAPSWSDDGNGTLVASYAVDSNYYSLDQYLPEDFYSVPASLVTEGSKKYIKIVINAAIVNPVLEKVKKLNEVILDLYLGQSPWYEDIKSASVYARDNTIHLGIDRTGMYEVSYDDLADSFVHGPLANANVSNLRLYQNDLEIPLEVESADSLFNTGDKIRFIAAFSEHQDSAEAFVVLSASDLLSSGTASLRFSSNLLNADPSQGSDSDHEINTLLKAEENNIYVTDTPVGADNDHFFWKMIFAPYPSNTNYEKLAFNLDIKGINFDSNQSAKLNVYLKGTTDEKGNLSDLIHQLGLYVNDSTTLSSSVEFKGGKYQRVVFTVPLSQIFVGTNSFILRSLAGKTPYSDRIQIDRVELDYPFNRSLLESQTMINNERPEEVYSFTDLTSSNVRIFDLSSIDFPQELTNIEVTDNGGTYTARYYAHAGADAYRGQRFLVVDNEQYHSVTSMKVNRALVKSLADTNWNRQFIIIGSRGALEAAEELIDRRTSQGMSILALTYQDIYNQFSFARVSSFAIKDFLLHAYDNWSTKPAYVLLIGDSTYDPKDLFGYGLSAGTTPMPIVDGMVYDFGSDNWFVTRYDDVTPLMSIGRIPSTDPAKIQNIIKKSLDFEDELASPDFSSDRMISFLVDQSDSNEQFDKRALEISGLTALSSSNLSTQTIDRSVVGDAAMATAMEGSFASQSLIVNYLGHGAEDTWTDNLLFTNDEADALSNTEYPLVMALNCLNNYFYDPDETWVSLGESLVNNQNGGAVAFIGSTAMTTPVAQTQFAKSFYQVLSDKIKSGAKDARLGDMILLAKQGLPNEGYYKDVQNSYLLLGDPTMKFPEKLFFEPPPQSVTNSAPAPAKKGGFGCSANASENSNTHPLEGLIELFGLLACYIFSRWLFRRYKIL